MGSPWPLLLRRLVSEWSVRGRQCRGSACSLARAAWDCCPGGTAAAITAPKGTQVSDGTLSSCEWASWARGSNSVSDSVRVAFVEARTGKRTGEFLRLLRTRGSIRRSQVCTSADQLPGVIIESIEFWEDKVRREQNWLIKTREIKPTRSYIDVFT